MEEDCWGKRGVSVFCAVYYRAFVLAIGWLKGQMCFFLLSGVNLLPNKSLRVVEIF
jgi:hypothetical protein